MSVDNKNVIDAVSINEEKKVILTISDHLEWDNKNDHLLILQDKINAYLEVLESGEIYESYPKAEGKEFVVQIVFKYPPDEDGREFLRRVGEILQGAGYGFNYYILNQ